MRYSPDSELRRKDHVPSDVRTQGKDEAAQWIETHIAERDRWPMPKKQIAEESGWSRQHISNVLDQYFDVVEPDSGKVGQGDTQSRESGLTTQVKVTVDELSKIRNEAYREGFQDGQQSSG